jgi:[ribosomal protein S5]-alanine N-acetyltransferase
VSALPLPEPPLEDGVVRVRGWRPDDLWARVEAWRDPSLMRFMLQPAPAEPSVDDAAAWLAVRERRREQGEALFLVVAEVADDRACGSVWLWNVDAANRRGEVGYWLLREARGRGLATRAVRLVCAYAFEKLRLERLELFTLPGNAASERVAERAGFQREGMLRAYRRAPSGRVDVTAFSLLAEDAYMRSSSR